MAPEEIFLRFRDGKAWSTCCRQCFNPAEHDWPQAGKLDWLKSPPEDLDVELLRTVNELRVCAGLEPHVVEDNRREYMRHTVELTLRYRRKKESEARDGTVRDLSKGGLCFLCTEPLKKAEIIHVAIANPSGEHTKFSFNSDVEVVRCIVLANKRFEIGGRFIGQPNKNKRRDERHQLLLSVLYQRKGAPAPAEGAVIDISRSGVGFVVQEEIPAGEVLAVCIRGDSGAFGERDLRGLVRVVHSKCLYEGNYELGTEFIKTKVIPRQTPGGQPQEPPQQ